MEEVYNLSFLCNGKTKQKAEKRGCSHLGCSHTWPKYLTRECFFDHWKGSVIIINLFSHVSEVYHCTSLKAQSTHPPQHVMVNVLSTGSSQPVKTIVL